MLNFKWKMEMSQTVNQIKSCLNQLDIKFTKFKPLHTQKKLCYLKRLKMGDKAIKIFSSYSNTFFTLEVWNYPLTEFFNLS